MESVYIGSMGLNNNRFLGDAFISRGTDGYQNPLTLS